HAIWEIVAQTHSQVDSVLLFEKELSREFPSDRKYSFEERNNLTVRVYSKEFSEAYAEKLDG
ncbi:MAG TPA: S1/P1 Nuclease, partial [Algoriphagus sp.]|nr:S1/P1 Nuclease [Algoriphagus sp.]